MKAYCSLVPISLGQKIQSSFFSPITPTHATSQSRATQVGLRTGYCKGVRIDQEIENCCAHTPRHSYACYKSIKGCRSGLVYKTLQRGQHRLRNRKTVCTYTPAFQTTISPPLSSTIQGHYLMPPQIFPQLRRFLILGQNMLQIFQRKKLQSI